MMQGKSGLKTAVALRINGYPGKIAGISAFLTPGLGPYWKSAGCDIVLLKGLPPRDLVLAVPASAEASAGGSQIPRLYSSRCR
jgi:hypothetical protein